MKRTLGHLLRFLVILFTMIVDVSVLVSCQSFSVFASPPMNSDWVVTGTESYYDEVFVLNGNLIVESSGNLTFRKVTLRVNCTYNGQYNITVMPGGKFYVLEGSVITSENPGKRIGWFFVHENSTFRMNNSELHECGYMDPYSCSGLWIRSNDVLIENSLFSRHTWGINVLSNGTILRNNNITANDYRGIAIHFCSPTIYNNTITSSLGAGIAIFWNNSNPLIQDNIIALNNVGISGWNCGR